MMEPYVQDIDENVHLSDYLYVVRKRKGVIVAFALIVVTLVAVVTLTMTPIYKATARMVIDKESKKSPLTGEQVDYETYASESLTFQTHFKLIKSRPVLSKVYEVLNLEAGMDQNASAGMVALFVDNVRRNLNKLVLLFQGRSSGPAPPEGQEQAIDPVALLEKKIDVEQVRNTRLVLVSARDQDPAMAQSMANAVCNAYIQYNMDLRLQATQGVLSWLADEMGKMKEKLEESEARFLAFKEREKIFSITGKQKVHTQKIGEINTSYINTRSSRVDVEARIAELERILTSDAMVEFPPAFARNALLSSLYEEQALLAIELKKSQRVYKAKHPQIVKITTKLEQTKKRFRTELQKVLLSLRSEHSVLATREKALEEALDKYETDALETNKKEAAYAILEREVKTNKELYNVMSTKVKESMISQGIETVNIRLAEPASRPADPFKPKKMLNLVLALMGGLMGGIGLSFFREYLDQTVKTPEDLERHLGLPVLAVVQDVSTNGVGK
ncbi:MAG: GumC family protein [Thermodesulfobacteriota bacterium]|nr:GumC family protein [Thermodesulfobacteriota bacterium]